MLHYLDQAENSANNANRWSVAASSLEHLRIRFGAFFADDQIGFQDLTDFHHWGDEALWAELEDSKVVPIATSLALLDAVHARWLAILRAMSALDFECVLVHPESGRQRLDQMLALYAWHGPHHVAHVTKLRERMGW